MLLNLEQIRTVTRGAVRVEEEDGWFRLLRFTETQALAYLNAGKKDFYNKTSATAGVRLAFRTTSRKLAFDYRLKPGSSRKFAWFDLYENGAMVQHFGSLGEQQTSAHVEIGLSAGEKNVELYLPWSCRADLTNVEIDDGATLEPIYRKKTMICFGDSITHGYDAQYPSLSYAVRVARMLDADVIDKGIGGDCFYPALLEKPDPIIPDLITVAYGTNDWNLMTPEEYTENCRAFYTRLAELYPNTKIYAITPIWRGDGNKKTPFGAPACTLHDVIAKICADIPGITVIRGWDMIPHHKDFFADFVLHPNDLGFSVYAENLYRAITAQEKR